MTISITVTGDNAADLVKQLNTIQAELGGAKPATTTKAKATEPKADPTPSSTPASSETPEAPKDEPAGGNSENLSAEDFAKRGVDWAKARGDNGAKLKEIWSTFKQADGTPVNRLGVLQPKDYDAFLAAMAEADLT